MAYLSLDAASIGAEHICCAFSDKKCAEGYGLKKQWLTSQFPLGLRFRRLDERAKVFIEYGPAEQAWVPVHAPDCLMLGCFWVSGRYAGHGHGKALLQLAIDDAKAMGKRALVTVAGLKKYHFMSDTKWLLKQGFRECDRIPSGFGLFVLDVGGGADAIRFNDSVRSGECPEKEGIVAYFSNRCPYTELHVRESLVESCNKRGLKLTIIKLETMEAAQNAPTPATIFSLFHNGRFVTTDLSICLDNRFDAALKRAQG